MSAADLMLDLVLPVAVLVLVGLLYSFWRGINQERDAALERAAQAEAESESLRKQARVAFQVGSEMLASSDQQKVIESAMRIGCEIFGAKGCSFVPFDEWGRSLSPVTWGNLPHAAMENWNESLLSPATRKSCKACKERSRQGVTTCTLLGVGSEDLGVYCEGLHSDGRDVGVLNFYLPKDSLPGETERMFFAEVGTVVDRALDMLRRRDQEMAALRYLQTSQARADLPSLLTSLLSKVQKALDVDVAALWATEPFDDAGIPIKHESRRDGLDAPVLTDNQLLLDGIWRSLSATDGPFILEKQSANSPWRALLAVPLRWGDEKPLGMLVLANRASQSLTLRQADLLQTIAGEAALLIRNAQLVVQVEYHAVVEERARLAREIHDGLAQTLAFLKIEATRMQNYVSKGEFISLTSTLDGCYRTISDAYLDARQAIDNLRCAPDDDFVGWIHKTALDFESISNIKVDVSQVHLSGVLPPYIQAQIMRVVQEALSNVRKHSGAEQVHLSLFEKNGNLWLEIADDGIGFSLDDTQPLSRHGLRGMHERANSLGADLQVDSAIGSGTTIKLSLPIYVQEVV